MESTLAKRLSRAANSPATKYGRVPMSSAFADRFFEGLSNQQKLVVRQCLEEIIKAERYMLRIDGRAGAGKSYCTGRIIDALLSMGVVSNIVACAPTHQAVKVLRSYVKDNRNITVGTAHSCIGLRAKKVTFTRKDERKLAALQDMLPELRDEENEKEIRELVRKQIAASQRLKQFEPASELPDEIINCQLLLVDECGMVGSQMYELMDRLRDFPEMEGRDPRLGPLQILFVGDLMQLPPVKEVVSKTGGVKAFPVLTEPLRYGGKILEYANAILQGENVSTAHYRIPQDDTFLIMTEDEVMDQIADQLRSGEDIRFLAATNARVQEINRAVRLKLSGEEGLKNYYTGDRMLTKSVIERSPDARYVVASGGQNPFIQMGTSTLIVLGPECLPSNPVRAVVDVVTPSQAEAMGGAECNDLVTRDDRIYRTASIGPSAFTYTSALGTTFRRRIFGYSFPGNPPEKGNGVVLLLDPSQEDQYREELALLQKLANSAYSSSANTTRGQNGDYAKRVFKAKGLKDWFRWKDGHPISDQAFKAIRAELWADYFDLANFVDNISLAFCSTVHRAQGTGIKIVVIDTQTILSSRRNYGDGTWNQVSVAYTAATRAEDQIVFMLPGAK